MVWPSEFADVQPLVDGESLGIFRAVLKGEPPRHVLLEIGSSAAFEMTRALSCRSVLKPTGRTTYHGIPALVFDDFGGVCLASLLDQPMPLDRFLPMSVAIMEAVAELHEQSIIHKNIRPENILVELQSSIVKLVGLSMATRACEPSIGGPRLIEGSFPYMAPEQTGRMNRPVDRRSDLYSVGVTLYRMLGGRLPFDASDPVEWVHCHVARPPDPLTEHVQGLPKVVSDIVMKLLAKSPDDRYQTARAAAADLALCRDRLLTTGGELTSFAIGTHDVSGRLDLSDRFYARERERDLLLAATRRIAETGTPELVLVSGPPGIGKSSLVGELRRLVPDRGAFAAAKADQFSQGIPYSTLATALRALVLESLTESEANILRLRAELDAALGVNARLMTDLVPELALLVDRPAPVVLPGTEAKHRFLATCQRLVGVFARKVPVLTLFFDDLQWADAASLDVVQYLVTHPDAQHMLVIGASRDAEPDSPSSMPSMIDAVRAWQVRVTCLRLGPLRHPDVTELVADALRTTPDRAEPLARLVHAKTEGNPFFIVQFLSALVTDGLLAFDGVAAAWFWDLASIEARAYTDNVVALMVQKIERLSPETRSMLRLAACIGTEVDEDALMVVAHRTRGALHRALEPAMAEGLLVLHGRSYRFLHDRIQQAAYSLVPEAERPFFRLEIARSLLASSEQRERHFFSIANDLVLGASAITTADERARSARVLYDAGARAKAAAAYRSAVAFLSAGVGLLDREAWGDAYELTYALHHEQAECLWLSGDFGEAERALPALLEHARGAAEILAIHGVRVRLHMIASEQEAALRAGIEAFRAVDVRWSLHPTGDEVKEALERSRVLLEERSVEDILASPEMTDRELVAQLDLVAIMTDAAFFVDWNLHSLLAHFAVVQSLRHGNTASSFASYAAFAFDCGVHGRYRDAARFAEVALRAVAMPSVKAYAAKICMLVATNTWVRSYRSSVEIYRRGEREAEELGDRLWGAVNASERTRVAFLAGAPLEEVAREIQGSIDALRRIHYPEGEEDQRAFARVVERLRGQGRPRDEEASAPRGRSTYGRGLALMAELHEHCVFGEHGRALEVAAELLPRTASLRGVPIATTFPFLHGLSLAATYPEAPSAVREPSLSSLRGYERTLRGWATSCPENFAAAHALLRAELARVTDQNLDAASAYEEAISAARASGQTETEAMANEAASRFYRGRGIASITKMYLVAAHDAYSRWGAEGKVKQLEDRHPELREQARPSFGSSAPPPEELDFMSVVKAAQTISEELDLDRLTSRLIEVAIEQSGAEVGRLLLVRGRELRLESEARTTPHGIETERPSGVRGRVPESVTHYVWRTHERVLIEDARSADPRSLFLSDEYIVRHRPRSIMCLPIVRGAEPVGILYLENNLSSHVFTHERLSALDVIAAQAAVTLETAFWIRQEQAARDALSASEARFRRLSDSNVFGLFFSDLTGHVTDANDYFLEMIGYTREDLHEGRIDWLELTPVEYHGMNEGALREILATGTCGPFEKEYVRKDGSRVPVLLCATLLEGSKTAAVTYVIDITDQKRTEQERSRVLAQEQEARASAEEALRVRDDFLAIAAHEIRTPLTPLKMQIEVLALLAKRTIPESAMGRKELLDLLEKSNRQIDMLSRRTAELIELSRARHARA